MPGRSRVGTRRKRKWKLRSAQQCAKPRSSKWLALVQELRCALVQRVRP